MNLELLANTYANARASVQLNQNTSDFPTTKGVRQEDAISPKLLTLTSENVFRKGLSNDGEYLSQLRFADDIVLIVSCLSLLQKMLGCTAVASAIVLVAMISFFTRSRKRRIPNKWTEIGHVSHLRVYPLKSGKGIACESLTCTESGVAKEHARDRMFLVVDSHGKCISGREYPRITQVAAEVRGSRLKLSGLEINTLEVDIPSTGVPVRLRIWGACAEGLDCGREASEWLTTYLGSETPLRLLYRGENVAAKDYIPHMKKLLEMTGTVTYKTDTGLFSDTFSYHLVSESSVRDLNSRMGDIRVTPFHFRPNIVVSGEKLIPFEEDRWKWLKIGDVVFQFLAPCMRCSFTRIDPETGARLKDDQPVSALRRYRIVRDQEIRKIVHTPTMGIYLGLRTEGVISIGDVVSIPEASS